MVYFPKSPRLRLTAGGAVPVKIKRYALASKLGTQRRTVCALAHHAARRMARSSDRGRSRLPPGQRASPANCGRVAASVLPPTEACPAAASGWLHRSNVRSGGAASVTGVGRLHELASVSFRVAEIQWPLFGFEFELSKAHFRPIAVIQPGTADHRAKRTV